MAEFEIHFTEGFTGQWVEILADGRVLAATELQTRFQTGLAHIEKLRMKDGEEVSLRLSQEREARVRLDASRPFVTVTLDDGALTVATSERRPGYL